MARVDLRWLSVYAQVARAGSIGAAADAIGVSHASVARQLSSLEAAVGSRLLVRLPHRVQLTEEGQVLFDHAESVLERLDVAQRELAGLRDHASGRLRLGAFSSANAVLVPRALAAFQQDHPAVSISHREGLTRQHLAALRAAEIDLAVISVGEDESPEDVTLHRLLVDRMLVALPAAHALAVRRRLRLGDLANETWIAGGDRPEEMLISASLATGFVPRIDIVVGEWLAKLGFVASGLGIALVPSIAVEAVPAGIRLVPLHPDDTPSRTIYAATPAYTRLSAPVAAFLRALREGARSLAYPGSPPATALLNGGGPARVGPAHVGPAGVGPAGVGPVGVGPREQTSGSGPGEAGLVPATSPDTTD